MLVQTSIMVTLSSSNVNYWRLRGYDVPKLGATKWGYQLPQMEVQVTDLPKNSNYRVEFWCEGCSDFFTKKASAIGTKSDQYCKKCVFGKYNFAGFQHGHTHGKANKGKKFPNRCGDQHPRWNPNKPAFKMYKAKVKSVEMKEIKQLPNIDKIRGLCGTDGAWQLDHRISKKNGFEQQIPPSMIGHVCNMQMLPWLKNKKKGTGSDMSIQELGDAIQFYNDYGPIAWFGLT